MSPLLFTLMLLGTEPSLSDPDPAVRVRAVEAWARKNAPVRLPSSSSPTKPRPASK